MIKVPRGVPGYNIVNFNCNQLHFSYFIKYKSSLFFFKKNYNMLDILNWTKIFIEKHIYS
jgi:hypothetical protein